MSALLADGGLPRGLDRAVVVFDFDGTLAPIVADRHRAAMRAVTRALLARLAAARPVAILSGRARRDLVRRFRGVPVRHLIGNHGAEWNERPPPATVARRVARWRRGLAGALADLPGVAIEDKGWSLAVHYRAAPSPSAAARRILAAVAAVAPDADLTGGKRVVNLGLPGHDKAGALARLHRRYRGRPMLFVGDDDNDERAFAAAPPGVTTARVGPARRTAARYRLPDQAAVDRLLRALLAGAPSADPAVSPRRPRAARPGRPTTPPGSPRRAARAPGRASKA